MKRRIPATITLLAVAITSQTACSRSGAPAPSTQLTAEAPSPPPMATATAMAQEPPAPSAAAQVAPPEEPNRPVVDKPELHPLRDELVNAKPAQVVVRAAHFRALCDKDGYPLVGNVAVGKNMNQVTQPSELCAGVRREARR